MDKYKKGLKILVKDNLIADTTYGVNTYVDLMKPLLGTVATIKKIVATNPRGEQYVLVEANGEYYWTHEMFESSLNTKLLLAKLLLSLRYDNYEYKKIDLYSHARSLFKDRTPDFDLSINRTNANRFFILFMQEYRENKMNLLLYIKTHMHHYTQANPEILKILENYET